MGDHSIRCRRGEGEGREGSDLAAVFPAAAADGGLASSLPWCKPAFPTFSVKIGSASRFKKKMLVTLTILP